MEGDRSPPLQKPDRQDLSQAIPANTNSPTDSMASGCEVTRDVYQLCSQEPITPALSGEKQQRNPNGETFYNRPPTPDCLLQTVKGTKHMESGRNDHSGEQPEETGRLNVLWCLGWDPGTKQ